MKVGGNRLAREFFEEEEDNWDNMDIRQRYNSKAAALYRDKISTLAENREWNIDEARAKLSSSNHSTMSHSKSTGAISSYQQESYQDGSYQNLNSQEFKSSRDNYFNNLQAANSARPDHLKPSEGGKYAGFGNTPQPTRSQSEVFDTNAALNSLSSGWSLLSLGASKVKDNALKYGSIATQKVVEVSQNVTEKVKDGGLLESASKEVTSFASKVGEFSKRGFSSFTNTGYNDIERRDNAASNQDWNWVEDVKNTSQQSYQNAQEDDWNGFDVNEPAPKTAEHAKSRNLSGRLKDNSSVEDFSSLDVKSKITAPKKPKDDKEDDLWDMLNS